MKEYVLQITSGVGPREVRGFVARLALRLEEIAERHGLEVRDVSSSGDDDAPRSVAVRLAGDAPAALGGEVGTHVLVHRSATRGRASRKRWFAAVSLHEAEPERPGNAPVPRADVVVTACRAGGPGGQHVNKVSSAVRVRHVPSGICVRVAVERSQKLNIECAIVRIRALLAASVESREEETRDARRRAHYRLERGRSVREYALGAGGELAVRDGDAGRGGATWAPKRRAKLARGGALERA